VWSWECEHCLREDSGEWQLEEAESYYLEGKDEIWCVIILVKKVYNVQLDTGQILVQIWF
jgi:hypothetical protein